MSGAGNPLTGPDFTVGVKPSEVPEGGMLLGHAHGRAALFLRRGGEVFALGATCPHYGAPLVEGLIVGHQLRCPWHHARFDVRTGEAVAAPALDSLPCWRVERRGETLVLGEQVPVWTKPAPSGAPESVLIVGAGAAGNAAAEMLRREGYGGPVTMCGAEKTGPVDRPNLSKDYLAGTAPEEWIALRGRDFYDAHRIELLLDTRVLAIEPEAKCVRLSDGSRRSYGALLLATGAEPIKLTIPGSDKPHVHTLRSLADSRAIIAEAQPGRRAVVVGASFIGLEVAASLRTRGLDVRVVAPGGRPLEHVLGPELGDFVRALHEEHGVQFHLGHRPTAIGDDAVTLDDGTALPADLIVVGIGVRPAVSLAEEAGLRMDRGVSVDQFLETSGPSIYAAGDIARCPDPRTGKSIRIEHWVVAERQGQTAARNILGQREPAGAVPFFWSQHYDVSIAYVGHAEGWDRTEVAGTIADKNCLVAFRVAGKIAAIAAINRDTASLKAEILLERGDEAGLEDLVRRERS